jgi:hypothetical protein
MLFKRGHRASGQVQEAVKLLEHVVEVRSRTLADDHPDLLASEGCLTYLSQELRLGIRLSQE